MDSAIIQGRGIDILIGEPPLTEIGIDDAEPIHRCFFDVLNSNYSLGVSRGLNGCQIRTRVALVSGGFVPGETSEEAKSRFEGYVLMISSLGNPDFIRGGT